MITANHQSNQLSLYNTDVFKSDLIKNALSLTSDKPLTEVDLAKMIGFSEEEINMISVYWNPVFNGSWIYLSDEMILEYLTNETGKYAIKNFYDRILLSQYEREIDYKEISAEHDLVKNGWLKTTTENSTRKPAHNKKYYCVTGEAYKCMLMSSKTTKGKF